MGPRLQEHDFDVKYKTGKKHSDADALSRNPVEEETETPDKFLAVTTRMNLAMEQKKDQDLAKLKLLSNSSKNEEFRFIDEIICRKNFDPDGKLWLPVIPKHLRADILRHFHDAPTAGHLGFAKLMTGFARDFTGRECTEMSFAEVDEIAKFLLEEIVLRHGAPRVIITDRGAVFRSRLVSLSSTCVTLIIVSVTAYHPQTNGLSERFNKTLADMLSIGNDTGYKLPFCPNDFDDNNITKIAARGEESRQLARVHTESSRQRSSTLRFQTPNGILRPGDLVLRRLSAVTYAVQDFDPASRKRKLREVVHVLRMKPYHDPAEQIETEDIPPKESYKGPITRSRIKTLEQK
ncbi:transposon Ty3-I Gag-Pol polyprotein [Trichonephila clavipes]|nr:transposon Ty3-I Gag-Pol polyprotein [Trichonephila clavipes]